MESFDNRLSRLKELISSANHIAFFGGAGVSTESGIPDFRSKDGLYNQHDVKFDKYEPEYLLSRDCLYNEPKVFFEFYRQKLDCRNIEPNITHKKLRELELTGKRVSVITQNIDELHQKAGSREVYAIHGTTATCHCTKCNKQFNGSYIFESEEPVPHCPDCGNASMVRPDIVLYGELPDKSISEAVEVLHVAELLIVAGTSLTVYPAASLIQDFYGKNLVIINNQSTSADAYADIIFRENLGEIFTRL